MLKKVDGLLSALKNSQKLTEGLPAAWEVNGRSLKVPLSHEMLTEIDGMSSNLTES